MKTKLTIAFAIIAATAVSASADTFKREMPQVILPMHQLSKPVAFDHLAHRQVECSSCHHKNDDGVESSHHTNVQAATLLPSKTNPLITPTSK